jgi:hypothetical protein
MICKKICTEFASFSVEDNKKDLMNLLELSCSEHPNGASQDYVLN